MISEIVRVQESIFTLLFSTADSGGYMCLVCSFVVQFDLLFMSVNVTCFIASDVERESI